MIRLTNDILQYYKGDKNGWYLHRTLANTNRVGSVGAFRKGVILSDPGDRQYAPTVDEHNTYEINSLGLRGEIDENSDVVASGCSITFGLGVPELGRWTNLLGNMMNKSVTNLGNQGASPQTICTDIIQYCLNTKMPKEIFCLFPDFFRTIVVLDKDFYQSKRGHVDIEDNGCLTLGYSNPTIVLHKGSMFMELEDSKYVEDSTSPHQLIWNSVNAIYMLEVFCLINDIKLYWTTWDIKTDCLLKEMINIPDFKLTKFTSFNMNNHDKGLNSYINHICKSSHGSEFKNTKCWNTGSDYSVINYKKTEAHSHPGIHFQQHVAEFFYELYKKDTATI